MPAAPLARVVGLLFADWLRGEGYGWQVEKALVVTIALQDDCPSIGVHTQGRTHTHTPSGHGEDPHRHTEHKHTQTHDTPSNVKHKGFTPT